MDADSPADVPLTDTQLGILAALCRPRPAGDHLATPATDQEIAAEVLLGVDAVQGHLRTLYRKFGIEDRPDDQKRARLVELAVEGGYGPLAETGPGADRPAGEGRPAPTGPATAPHPEAGPATAPHPEGEAESRRSLRTVLTAAVLILVVVGATLAISGVFNSGSEAPTAPTPAAFRAQVSGYCKLALAGAPASAGGDRAAKARGYLEVIEAMRDRLESLVPPTTTDVALERFGAGLTNAANYTSDIAERPPAAGSAAEAKDVAELTFAAGQVQAGAAGYRLGRDCLAIGDLVARSAANAAAS